MKNWFRDWGFGMCLWIGSWSIFDWLESFQGWLDTVLPWRLRARLVACRKENFDLGTELQCKVYEAMDLKRLLLEALHKMRMPIPLTARYNPKNELYGRDDYEMAIKTLILDFDRFRVTFAIDKYSFPHYSVDLLDYMAHHTADVMVGHLNEAVYKKVKTFYEKEFQGEFDGS
jgi:hypothetical protein